MGGGGNRGVQSQRSQSSGRRALRPSFSSAITPPITCPRAMRRSGLPLADLLQAFRLGSGRARRQPASLASFSTRRWSMAASRGWRSTSIAIPPIPTPSSGMREAAKVPGNAGLSAAERQRRVAEIYDPFHAALAGLLGRARAARPVDRRLIASTRLRRSARDRQAVALRRDLRRDRAWARRSSRACARERASRWRQRALRAVRSRVPHDVSARRGQWVAGRDDRNPQRSRR